jgi:diaminohydroxyphosphoribosylaminopyrimidine deaminase/5-amino-6-(5-phosphoribosylamino)uracil reductase
MPKSDFQKSDYLCQCRERRDLHSFDEGNMPTVNMDALYMKRALQLASLGLGSVSPNPMVGAVLVYNSSVVGEGYHAVFGGPHAEVNAIRSVKDKSILKSCTLYVSLEPCTHYGKTPPCTNLILESGIPRVVVACKDPNAAVAGNGIRILREAGIEVALGILEQEAISLNRRFFTNQILKRPYVILKWAETDDGFLAGVNGSPIKISSRASDLLVHHWRKEEDAILVGKQTVLKDNPKLTVRHTKGRNPVRILLDRNHSLATHYKVFDPTAKVIVLNQKLQHTAGHILYEWVPADHDFLSNSLIQLLQHQIGSILVEGGKYTLESFYASGLWDECRVIHSPIKVGNGLPRPRINCHFKSRILFGQDEILFGFKA